MRRQAVRTIALMLGFILVAAPAAQAGAITFGDLVRTVGASGQLRPASEVRLRFGGQGGAASVQGDAAQSGNASGQQQTAQAGSGAAPAGQASTDPTLSQSGGQVETVDLGDVTGTVCDCGFIPAPPDTPRAGFPWWPLLGGAIIPFIIPRGDEETPFTPPNQPPPPDTPIPEPMTLLLFGTGLLAAGAGARRRHGRRRLEAETPCATTEEV